MASPTAAASGRAPQHRHPAEPVDAAARPPMRPTVIATVKTPNSSGALAVVEAAVVDDADREPVVGRALGERHAEHDAGRSAGCAGRARSTSGRGMSRGRPSSPVVGVGRARRGSARVAMTRDDRDARADHAEVHARSSTSANAAARRCRRGRRPCRSSSSRGTSGMIVAPDGLLDAGARDVHGDVADAAGREP